MGSGRDRPEPGFGGPPGPAHEGTGAFLAGAGALPEKDALAPPARKERRGPDRVPRGLVLYAGCAGAAGMLLGLGISSGLLLPPLRAIGSFLDYYGGVFALVSLSLTVMIGVLATDRMILAPSHRVRAQAVHRAVAFVAVATLPVHVGAQLVRQRVGAVQAFLPHSFDHLTGHGLGTLAFYLLIIAFAGGVARGRFAAARHPWAWRALHLTAYAAWPVGVLHGLTSGRAPAPWVTAAYLLCLAAVALAVAARPVLRRWEGRTS